LEIINQTDFKFAYIAGRIPYPEHSLTLIIKGTFDLLPGQEAILAKEQLSPTGDEFYPDDEEMQGGARYSSDFAYFKPRADVLLVGKCHASKKTKVPARQVKFQAGSIVKNLNVFGNRYWKRGLLGSTATDPEPFQEIELRYEKSFGGERFRKNPVGKGINKIDTAEGRRALPLPNIVNPDDQVTSRGSKLEPAGFGPIGRMWAQRYTKLGTYKGNYLKERWPWFPKDFNWGYYNAAPSDMQVEGYLRGDEELYFENMHSVHSEYGSQLPGLRVRCFLNESDAAKENSRRFHEVPVYLDTLWVDMEGEKLVLVWRGVTNVKSEEHEEILHSFIVTESLEDQAQSVEYYWDQLNKYLIEIEEEEEYETEEPEVEDAEETTDDVEQEIAEAEAQMRASMIEAGLDPDKPPKPTPEQEAEEARFLKEMGIEEEPEFKPLTREIFQEQLSRRKNFSGEDLRGIDLSGLDMKEVDFQDTVLAGVSFINADLTAANFTAANLAGANLSGAELKNAILKEADLTDANLTGADMSGAILEDAIFEKAILNSAILDQTIATNAVFSEADFSGASIKKSSLNGADLSKSILNEANFQGSILKEASVEGATGIKVNMSDTDLTELRASEECDFTLGSFQKATGRESIWEKANLKEADFSFSQMEGADFTSASLEQANLLAANMKFARLTKANLTGAVLRVTNLFQGSLEKSILTKTDLSGSNLYGVEFLDSFIKDTRFEYSNLKMTKLFKK